MIENYIEEENLKVQDRESYIEEENLAARLHVRLLSEKQLQVLQVLTRFVKLINKSNWSISEIDRGSDLGAIKVDSQLT